MYSGSLARTWVSTEEATLALLHFLSAQDNVRACTLNTCTNGGLSNPDHMACMQMRLDLRTQES